MYTTAETRITTMNAEPAVLVRRRPERPPNQKPDLDDERRDRREEARDRHHHHVAVLDVGQLVPEHRLELGSR